MVDFNKRGSAATAGEVLVNLTGYYDRVLLDRLQPELLYGLFGEPHPLPEKEGSQITMRRYAKMSVATTALTEGVTKTGAKATHNDLTATPLQYGDYLVGTDAVKLQSPDPLRTVYTEILGEQAGETWDILDRNVLKAGTHVEFAGTATADTGVAAAMTLNDVEKVINNLERNDCRPIKSMIKAGKGIGTVPINKAFIAIIHPDQVPDVSGLTGWTPVEKYADRGQMLPGEIGMVNRCRFLVSTQVYIETGVGGDSSQVCNETTTDKTDIYHTVFLSQRAYGITTMKGGKGVQTIFKDLGSSGVADALNQRWSQGWKGWRVAKILEEVRIARLECGATAATSGSLDGP